MMPAPTRDRLIRVISAARSVILVRVDDLRTRGS
jgi:hypothetical protein